MTRQPVRTDDVNDIGAAFRAIVDISREYPSEELHVTVKAGRVILGIPKGEMGDRVQREWEQRLRTFMVGMS